MSGVIERIRAYATKGDAGLELAEARLIANSGLEGDFHASGGERQISLLVSDHSQAAGLAAQSGQKEKGLCLARFKENISIVGIAPRALRPGACFCMGDAVLEITGETKHCHEECALFQAGKACHLAGQSLFAKVVKSGIIHKGDRIRYESDH